MLKISYQTSHASPVFKDLIKFKGIALRYFHKVWYIVNVVRYSPTSTKEDTDGFRQATYVLQIFTNISHSRVALFLKLCKSYIQNSLNPPKPLIFSAYVIKFSSTKTSFLSFFILSEFTCKIKFTIDLFAVKGRKLNLVGSQLMTAQFLVQEVRYSALRQSLLCIYYYNSSYFLVALSFC